MTFEFGVFFVKDMEGLRPLVEHFTDGWVSDPVLMPSGRPNVIEGIGAIYHLVKGDDLEIGEYTYGASPEFTLDEIRKELKEYEEAKPGEFSGDDLTLSLLHGATPHDALGEVKGAGNWRIFKVYEKVVIWIRHGEEIKQ